MRMKTLSQVNPKADYSFDPRDVGLKRPYVQARIARVIAIWAGIESLTVNVLLNALGGDIRIASEMFLSVTSGAASRAALKTAIRLGLPPDRAAIFNAIWTISGELVDDRHKLAHWIVGYSKDIPNALLLLDPKDGFRRGAHNLTFWRLGQHHKFTRRPIHKIRVLSAEYLDSLTSDFYAQQDRLMAFLDLLRLDETADVPPAAIQRRYDQLCNEPRIRQILIQAHENQKNTKAIALPRPRRKSRGRDR